MKISRPWRKSRRRVTKRSMEQENIMNQMDKIRNVVKRRVEMCVYWPGLSCET